MRCRGNPRFGHERSPSPRSGVTFLPRQTYSLQHCQRVGDVSRRVVRRADAMILPVLNEELKVIQRIPTVTAILLATVAIAQENAAPKAEPKKPARAKAPEVLRNAVDPYVPTAERARFFRAAGKDNELTAEEFAADRKRTSPFVRKFDHWPMLIRFDKDRNKTIDWFEADRYRRQVRAMVLEAFDTKKDRRLTGKERAAANKALSSEKFLAARLSRGKPRVAPGGASVYQKQMVERYDRDKDGEISDEERRKAFAEMRERDRKRMLEEYDKDADGELGDDERAAMRNDQARPWKEKIREWQLRDHDHDGDGELDEDETAELKVAEAKFAETMKGVGRTFELRTSDFDGDGEVTADERKRAREQWNAGMIFKALARVTKYVDEDGDGTASPEEWLAFRKRSTVLVMDWMERSGLKYDADNDGRLNSDERDVLMRGIVRDTEARLARHDSNKDGILDPDELLDMIEGLMDEIGLRPLARRGEGPPR